MLHTLAHANTGHYTQAAGFITTQVMQGNSSNSNITGGIEDLLIGIDISKSSADELFGGISYFGGEVGFYRCNSEPPIQATKHHKGSGQSADSIVTRYMFCAPSGTVAR